MRPQLYVICSCTIRLLVVLLACSVVPRQAASQDQSTVVIARKTQIPHRQPRLATSLQAASQIVTQRGIAAARTALVRGLRMSQSGEVEVYIYASKVTEANLQTLQQHGVQIQRVHEPAGLIYASLSMQTLPTVAALDFVRWIAPPSYGLLRTGSVTSAADAAMRTADVRTDLGVDGSNVRVGIISDSLIDLQASVDTGDLPPDLIIVDGNDGSNLSRTIDEGRAMAELIHDLAPGATLLFHSGFPTSLDTVAAIEALTAAGADIIVDDLGFFFEPVFEDGPVAQAVQEAIDNGVVYVTSAGNAAEEHYHAPYREFDANDFDPVVNLHDFGGGDTTMAITIAPESFLQVVLQWPNRFDGSANTADYDLFLFDASGTVEACTLSGLDGFCASVDAQLNAPAPPLEVVFLGNRTSQAVTVNVVINRFGGAALPLRLLFAGQIRVEEHNVARGSIFGHPCVRDALAVGAIDAADPGFDTIEAFSSQGPCEIMLPVHDSRTKPDLVGADGTRTSLTFFDPFFGTSAAAPHVAAVAALLMEAAGGPDAVSPMQLADTLRRAAIDLGAVGNDNVFGHGSVDAMQAVDLLLGGMNTAPQSTIDSPAGDIMLTPGESLAIQGNCVDAEEDTPFTFAWDFGDIAAPSTAQNPGLLTFANSGTFPITFTCTDATVASDDTPAVSTVIVNQPPQSRITSHSSSVIITAGSQIDFAGVCSDTEDHEPYAFLWSFGSGADIISSTEQNPSNVLFNTPGDYTVSFVCQDAFGTASISPATVRVLVNPSVDGGSKGGGCRLLSDAPHTPVHPVEALGNLFLPVAVIFLVRLWRRRKIKPHGPVKRKRHPER